VTVSASADAGLVAQDIFSQYANNSALKSLIASRTKYNDNINTADIDLDQSVLFRGGSTMRYAFWGGQEDGPMLVAPISPVGDLWFRYTVRWSPGFTTNGEYNGVVTAANPTGQLQGSGYKFFFFAYNEYDGRSGVELTNNNIYISYIDYHPAGIPDIIAFTTPRYSNVQTEWTDGAFYDYILHYEVLSPMSSRMSFYIGRDGTKPVLMQQADLTATDARYPMPKASKLLLGRNFNQKRLPNATEYLWVARWQVYDGTKVSDPFGVR